MTSGMDTFRDLSHAEIHRVMHEAWRLGIPVGTVKSRSHRAHRRLAGLLSHLKEATA